MELNSTSSTISTQSIGAPQKSMNMTEGMSIFYWRLPNPFSHQRITCGFLFLQQDMFVFGSVCVN